MLNIQAGLERRFPQWFEGRKAMITRPLLHSLARFNRFDVLERIAGQHAHLEGLAFVDAVLRDRDCRYLVDDVEREHIPESGPCLIVANHPLGGLDALALLKCVGDIRRDVRIVANELLSDVSGLGPLLLPVRILGGAPTVSSLQLIGAALRAGQAAIVFPAGEVSRLGPRGIRDGRWQKGFVSLAERSSAILVLAHLSARNSALFYGLSALYRPLGAALLARELSSALPRRIGIRLSQLPPISQLKAAHPRRADLVAHLRNALYASARGLRPYADIAPPVAHAPRLRALLMDIAQLQQLGETGDGKQILCGRLRSDSALMQEIARLREFTFRSVGEGTGLRLDQDAFDAHYQQLVVWDKAELEVAGAYRIADCREVIDKLGLKGLYCATLFEFTPELISRLSQSMELGRSFVQPRYWGSRSLDYLWMGIGAWLRAHPHVRHLYGPVSISATLPAQARDLLVAYYSRYFGASSALAMAHHPFRYSGPEPQFGTLDAERSLALLRDNLAALGARIPTLYRQYTELCEPGGARFIAFGVDPDFSNSVDGLIWVDLDRVTLKKRRRYLDAAPDPASRATTCPRLRREAA